MALHTYEATRSPGGYAVTRSTDDGLTGGTRAVFSFDDSSVLTKRDLSELWQDTINRLNEHFRGVSAVSDLGAGVEAAFEDGSIFDDGALFADQGAGGHLTWLASLAADNNSSVSQNTDNAIGSADAVLILNSNLTSKIEARNAIEAIRRGLKRDSLAFSLPSSYPTSGSFGV